MTNVVNDSLTYAGNGSQTVFAIDQLQLDNADTLVVTVAGVAKVRGTDFTVQAGTSQINNVVPSTITFAVAPANLAAIVISLQPAQRDVVLADDGVTGRDATTFTGNGSQTVFSIGSVDALTGQDFVVTVGGVVKVYGTDYTVDTAVENITFAAAPANSAAIAVSAKVPVIYNPGIFPDPFRPPVADTSAVIADPFTGFTPVFSDPTTSVAETNHISAEPAPLGQTTITLNKDAPATFTGDGTTTTFTLPWGVGPSTSIVVKVNGTTKTLTTDYTYTSAGVLTFTTAPASSAAISVQKTFTRVNIDDINNNEPAFTTAVTRTNS